MKKQTTHKIYLVREDGLLLARCPGGAAQRWRYTTDPTKAAPLDAYECYEFLHGKMAPAERPLWHFAVMPLQKAEVRKGAGNHA